MLGYLIVVYPDALLHNESHQDAAGVWESRTKKTMAAGVWTWSRSVWCQCVAFKGFECT